MNPSIAHPTRRAGNRRVGLGAALLAAGALLCAPAAWAANAADLSVGLDVKPSDDTVSPQTWSVSVSRAGLDSFISYRVTFRNTSTNTVNQVRFTATATVTGAASGIAGYTAFVNLAAANPNCAAPPAPNATPTNTVSCAIGQLKAGEGREFFLIFRAPEAGATVEFDGATDFSSGNSSNTPPASFTKLVENSMVLTTTVQQQVNTSVITVLPPRGGSFFTGPNAQADGTNLFTTKVQVPSTLTTSTPTVTDNRIDQASVPGFACSPGYFCYGHSSDISVDDAKNGAKVDFTPLGTSGILAITLRQDAASVTVKKPTPGVFDVRIFYTPTGSATTIELAACGSSLPSVDVPCVKARTDALKGKKGYYEYLIWARDNGRISW
jgi:hypothetical protein